jgi:hypothetical protein
MRGHRTDARTVRGRGRRGSVAALVLALSMWPMTIQAAKGGATAMTDQENTGSGEGARLRVLVEVGNEYVEPGQTRIEVQPGGRTFVTNRLEGKEERGETTIDPAKLESSVSAALSQMSGVQARSTRHGLPDEPRYHIEVEREGRRVLSAELWRSEVEKIPSLQRLLRELEEAGQRAIDGRLAL